jgi:hypothetical protein
MGVINRSVSNSVNGKNLSDRVVCFQKVEDIGAKNVVSDNLT